MSSARFSDPEDRHRQGRITRTNSSLDLDLDRARSELDRAQDALLRDRVRERRHRLNLEDDDFDYHDFRFEIDELEELVRRRRRLIERGAQTARHIETDSPMVRLMRLLSDVPSSVPDSRRGTRSSALPQAGGSSVSSSHHQNLDLTRVEEIKQMLRVDDGRLFRSQHLTTQRTASSRPPVAERNNALLKASGYPVIRPRSVGLANPSGGLATPSTEVSPVVPNQEPSPEAKMRNKLLNMLWSQPVGLIHGHLSKSRVKGSGEWLFTLPGFESWRKVTTESPKGIEAGENCLWLQGGIGAGKTMLMNAVVSRLNSEVLNEPGQENIVIYYYFDRSGGCKPYQAVYSLLRQICDQKDIPLPKFLAEMETDGSDVASRTGDRQPNGSIQLANLVSDFLSVLSRFKRVYIALMAWKSVGLKETVGQLEDHNSSDIRQYLEEFVQCQQRICLSDMIGNEARSGLLDKIVEKSGGNFLSAVAQAAQLNRLTSLADVTDQLEKPPLQLSEVVNLILSQLNDQPPQRYRLAQKVFYWLSVARRPLTLRELQQAVAVEPGARIDDPNRLPPPSLITAVCMGFVHVNVKKNRVFAMPSALPFYLYQFIGEFARQAREYAAISCLALLQSGTLSHGPFTSQSQYDDIKQRLPFASYVSQNWGIHLNDAREDESMNEILENPSLLETLSQLLHVSSQPTSVSPQPYDNYPTGFGSRHFGAYFGLTIAFSKWSTQEDWAVARDSWNRSPFHVCFRSPGLCERHVLFDLLEGEDVSSLMFGGTSSASQPEPEDEVSENHDQDQAKPFRHEAVRGLPWKWGLDYDHNVKAFWDSVPGKNLKKLFTFSRDEINVADTDGKTPLHHFLVDWSEDTLIGFIQMTFDRDGAPEHREDDDGESNDDSDDSSDLKKSLGERKSLPLVADNSGRTTLDYACERNILFGTLVFETAKWSPEQMNNGITVAASCGYAVLVNYLCEKIDEKPNTKREEFELGRAVIKASKRRFTDIVRLLRQMGTDLGIQDDNGMSSLHHAAYGCHTDTVRFLLLEGADPNQLDKVGRSPLFCGCESGSDTIVTLLREKGASATRANSDGQTLLHLAAYRGNVDVARRLLRLDGAAVQLRTPDPDAAGLSLQSPLHIAAREGHHAVVKLLVEEGFLIGARDGDGRTPLSYACEGGHIESVQVLLNKKRFAAVNSTDKDLRTPLSYAAAEGHVNVVATLVGHGGVDPNIEDVEGKTALIHAAERGHNDTVVVLILLASNSYTVRATVMRSFEELYSRFSSKATGNIAVDVNMKDNRGQSAVFYLKRNGGQRASDVARYIVEIGEKPKPKTLMNDGEGMDDGEVRAEGGDGDRNKPAESPEERHMSNDDQDAGQQPGVVDMPIIQA